MASPTLSVTILLGFFLSTFAHAEHTGPGERAEDTSPALRDKIKRSILYDRLGVERSLSSLKTANGKKPKAIVLLFSMTGCPATESIIPSVMELEMQFRDKDVLFVALSPNDSEGLAEIASFAQKNGIPFPVRKDRNHELADLLEIQEVPTAVVLDDNFRVRYTGLFDDSAQMAVHKPKADNPYVEKALGELLSGKAITEPRTEASGCPVIKTTPNLPKEATYVGDVENIIKKSCVPCHRPGGSAPTSFTSYEEIVKYSDAIKKVLQKRMMPPTSSDPLFSEKLTNDHGLSEKDRRQILGWIEAGLPLGKGQEKPTTSWIDPQTIGQPDAFFMMPKEVEIPARGKDQLVTTAKLQTPDGNPVVSPQETTWVTGSQVYPGVQRSVHEVRLATIDPKTGKRSLIAFGGAGENAISLPEGTAFEIPKGSNFELFTHYSSHGVAAGDNTKVGIATTTTPPKHIAHLETMEKKDLRVPAGTPHFEASTEMKFGEGSVLHGVSPVANSRAVAFRYDLIEPGKKPKTILTISRFDPRMTKLYQFEKPMTLPKDVVLRMTAVYDNSANNPQNPDSKLDARSGKTYDDEKLESVVFYITPRK